MGRCVFLSGGTGYIGASLIPRLLQQEHDVRVLCRPGSERKVPPGSRLIVSGNALEASTFSAAGCDTFVHMVGTPHPAPWKAQQFRDIDLQSLRASVAVAKRDGISHFVYISVAHPAPVMRSYIEVRMECERLIAAADLRTTILRPWYVLGPGHRWPSMLMPLYEVLERLPSTRAGAERLGLVTLQQMVDAVVWSVDHPPLNTRVLDVPAIRSVAQADAQERAQHA